MKLINIKENMGYIENSCNIGYIAIDTEVILIDSGLDDTIAKKVIKLLDAEGYKIKAIINTHSHADHCGGNQYIQNKLGVQILAPEFESAIIENPYLEPLYLSAGAAPIKELTSKFLMAKPSKVNYIISKEEKKVEIDSVTLNIESLLGHAINQIGIAVDGILYCGDSILSDVFLQKHKIPFNVNIDEQIRTLETLKESNYEMYVPSHCPPMNKDQLVKTVEKNLKILQDINQNIIKILHTYRTLEEIECDIFKYYDVTITSLTQYSLFRTSIIAHINYLFNQKCIEKLVKDNKVYWKKTF